MSLHSGSPGAHVFLVGVLPPLLEFSFEGLAAALRQEPSEELMQRAREAYRSFVPEGSPALVPASFREWDEPELLDAVRAADALRHDGTVGLATSQLPYLLQVLHERGFDEQRILAGE